MGAEVNVVDLKLDHVWATDPNLARAAFVRRYGRNPEYVRPVELPTVVVRYWAAGPVNGNGAGGDGQWPSES